VPARVARSRCRRRRERMGERCRRCEGARWSMTRLCRWARTTSAWSNRGIARSDRASERQRGRKRCTLIRRCNSRPGGVSGQPVSVVRSPWPHASTPQVRGTIRTADTDRPGRRRVGRQIRLWGWTSGDSWHKLQH
jgi:hypothetical protein